MTKLKVYTQEDLINNKDEFKKNNAFIKKDGSFYLAKGYTGCNPSHQLDSSALAVGRFDIGDDFITNYYNCYMEKQPIEKTETIYKELNKDFPEYSEWIIKMQLRHIKEARERVLLRKRSILVQYYGYAMFAKIENLNDKRGREMSFFDHSDFPRPQWYGLNPTVEQIQTMKLFYEINNNSENSEETDKQVKLLLNYYIYDSWNC